MIMIMRVVGSINTGKKDEENHLAIVDNDENDDDMWVEKNIDMEGKRCVFVLIIQSYVSPDYCIKLDSCE